MVFWVGVLKRSSTNIHSACQARKTKYNGTLRHTTRVPLFSLDTSGGRK